MTEFEAATIVWRQRIKRAQKIEKERDRHQFLAYVLTDSLRGAHRAVKRSFELVEQATAKEAGEDECKTT